MSLHSNQTQSIENSWKTKHLFENTFVGINYQGDASNEGQCGDDICESNEPESEIVQSKMTFFGFGVVNAVNPSAAYEEPEKIG